MKDFRTHRSFASTLVLLLAIGPSTLAAPRGLPTFTNPLQIDNPWFPFLLGMDKAHVSQQGNLDLLVFEHFTNETRTFDWNGTQVECRVLVEEEYEDGELAEISKNYFGEADDGTVYYFGEVVDIYGGPVILHDGSWLVGGPTLPGDPPTTGNAPDPAVFMPPDPQVGDTWKPEDLFPIVDETVVVEKVEKTVVVPYGVLKNCIKVRESSALDPGTTVKWYAYGLGFVQSKEPAETLALEAVTP